jgi:hypothetical protein
MEPDLEADIAKAMNRLRGQLAGFIEACNLPEKTERGMVNTMKSLSYECEKDIKALVAQ